MSFWLNFHHCLHRKLLEWQLSVKPVTIFFYQNDDIISASVTTWYSDDDTFASNDVEVISVLSRYKSGQA